MCLALHELGAADNAGGDRLQLEADPTSTETPPTPPSRIPAVTAARAEMTKTAVRTEATWTPASCAARALSPVAKTRRPNTVPCSPHCASAQNGEHKNSDGEDLHDRHVVKDEAAEHPEIVGQIAAWGAARPHH
jgi:hypothetical protein